MLQCVLVRSHLGGKSSTGMTPSVLRQSGELLHEPVDVVPATFAGTGAQAEMDQNQGLIFWQFLAFYLQMYADYH